MKENNPSHTPQELLPNNGEAPILPCNLDQLEPLGFIFNPSSNFRNMFKDLTKHIEEFVQINNEYVNIKVQEEKAKNKKQK